MATSIVVSTSPVGTGRVSPSKPRKLFRNVKRTLIRKCLAKVNALLASDTRDYNRLLSLGIDAAQVTGYGNDKDVQAFVRVQARLAAALNLKEGDR